MHVNNLRSDALEIFNYAVRNSLPDSAVEKALSTWKLPQKIILVAIGKAAWRMAHAAVTSLSDREISGAVITKYGHSQGPIGNLQIFEAGHPISDKNTVLGTKYVLEITEKLTPNDCVLFLVSGGGSALFEAPLPGITIEDIVSLNKQLLESGAKINEVNTLRKRFSLVKGGRFAEHCKPASVYQIILSDVVGDDLSSVASGPAIVDVSSAADVESIIKRYNLTIQDAIFQSIQSELPRKLENVKTLVTGSVRELCRYAINKANKMGYDTHLLTDSMSGEARDASDMLYQQIKRINEGIFVCEKPCALIMGGETTVTIRGSGMGGRSQEMALYAAQLLSGYKGVTLLAAGSDGTDGPTDAAGGIIDGETWERLKQMNINPKDMLDNNDSYNALKACEGLVFTGPTGTNVNDLVIALVL